MPRDYYAEEIETARQPSIAVIEKTTPSKDYFAEEVEPFLNKETRSNLLTKPGETLLRSGGEFLGNIFSAIGHPIQTAKAIIKTGLGLAEKIIPGEQPHEQYINALGKFYIDRYGSLDKARTTALEDPIGFASDLSVFLGGVGGVATKAGQMSKLTTLAKTGQLISKAGRIVDPLSAVMQGTGAAIKTFTAGKKLAPFASKMDMPVVKAAEEIGVELPASAKTTSRFVPQIEAFTAKGLGGQAFAEKVEKARTILSSYADDLVAQSGRAEDLTSAGKSIFQGADAYRNTFIKIKNELYSGALLPDKGKTVIKVNPENSLKFVNEVLSNKQEAAKLLGSSEDIAYFRNLANKLKKGTTEEVGILSRQGQMITRNIPIHGKEIQSAIRELNHKVNNISDPIATGNKATLKKLTVLLSEDLDNAIVTQRPDLAEAINNANKFYSEGIQKLNSAYGEKIFELGRAGQYDKILPAIINKGASIEDIPRIFEIIGKENVPALRAAFLEEFFKGARNADGSFRPTGISSQISRYGGDVKLRAILTPQQYGAVKNIDRVARSFSKLDRITGGSQTAFLSKIIGEAALFAKNPLYGLSLVAGDIATSKFVGSKMGQEFLSSGIELTGRTGEKIKSLAQPIGRKAGFLRVGGIVSNQNE